MAAISIEEYQKALFSLEDALTLTEASPTGSKVFELNRDGSIQRFEFCVELAWKVSAKELGLKATSPKMALREMLKSGLIADFDLWFDFIVERNKSSHTYDKKIAHEVYQAAKAFLPQGIALLKGLQKL